MAGSTFIKVIILLLVGLIVFGVLIEQAAWQVHGTTVHNDSITFTTNNTYYGVQRTPILAIIGLYNDSAHTCTYASTLYTFDSIIGIKIYSNDTDDPTGAATRCPNMTSGNKYYTTYTLVKPTGVGGAIMYLMIGVLTVVILLSIYLKKI